MLKIDVCNSIELYKNLDQSYSSYLLRVKKQKSLDPK